MVRTALGRAMFEREPFEHFVLSRIPEANRVKPGRLWLIALRARSPQALLLAAALVVLVVAQAVRVARHL